MIARATTTVTIYRGESEDDYGDPTDDNTIVDTGVRASILEQTVKAWTEVSTLPRQYRWAKMRVTPGTDIQQDDRIYDERTGDTWTIIQISNRANPVRAQDMRIDLEMMG